MMLVNNLDWFTSADTFNSSKGFCITQFHCGRPVGGTTSLALELNWLYQVRINIYFPSVVLLIKLKTCFNEFLLLQASHVSFFIIRREFLQPCSYCYMKRFIVPDIMLKISLHNSSYSLFLQINLIYRKSLMKC